MSEPWKPTTIRQCLVESFAGEWGGNPRPGNAKVLRATDIDDDGHVVGPGAIRQLPIGKLTAKRLLDGDILLEGSGGGPGKPVGRVAYFEADDHYEAAVCSNFFKTLRPMRSEVEPRFLLRKLAWFYKQPALLALQQQTTGIINLKFEEYLSAQIEIPGNIVEQQKLAQVLDTLDTAIHETESIIAKLKAVKQGMLHDLLTRGIDANGELRRPQAEAPHLYKKSPLGWIPNEWEIKTITEIADVKSGSTPSREQANRYFAANGTPWVKTLDLNEDVICETDECITATALRETSCSLLPQGTVLVAMYGGWEQIGRTALLAVSAATNQAISALVFRSARTVPEFVLRALQHGRPRWQRVAASTRKDPNITKTDVLAFEVPLPAPNEQSEIASRVRASLDRLEFEADMLAKLRHQKSGLMEDLLTGRVRVTSLLAEAEQKRSV
ncbi:restriction endonuclease subunit S [Stenotrophomonas sp.]|uniref:restriction endonuclease subunit S n=1 Tax=Stenotrophomonas sp. TaxID=69392 RepID=UPI0028B1415F|nr:restriction endonuclease subunit S [Stenotrophomonas sp.]